MAGTTSGAQGKLTMMLRGFLLSLFLLITPGPGRAADLREPGAAVQAFYTICREERLSGLPDARQLERLSGLLSTRLIALIEAARARQARFQRERPDEKPPFVEGDLFSSLFEGPTGFAPGAVRLDGDRARVTVHFSHRDESKRSHVTRWTDDAWLVRERGQWRIDDVEYHGGWPFAARGRLARNLAGGPE
jgi:hypothetical protein